MWPNCCGWDSSELQTAYGRLPITAWASYADLTKALKDKFEPEAMKEMYVAEFQVRKKARTRGWAEFANHLKLLADKAFPELEDKAREYLALTQFTGQVDNPQVAFSVRQKRPTTLIEAVSATIEMESYLKPKPSYMAQVEPEQSHADTAIAAVQLKQDTMMGVLEKYHGEAGKTGSPGKWRMTHTNLEFRAQGKETCGVP